MSTQTLNLDLDRQRGFGAMAIVGLGWGLVPVALAEGLLAGESLLFATLPMAVLALLQTVAWKTLGQTALARSLSAVLLMAQISTLVAGLKGHPFQVDMHMAYFAALAVVIVYCDWRAILAAAATVAVHHLVLSFVMPDLVFPGSASLARVVLHAPRPPPAVPSPPARPKRPPATPQTASAPKWPNTTSPSPANRPPWSRRPPWASAPWPTVT